MTKIDTVILSAGSEIITLAIAEELISSQQTIAVIALRSNGLLAGSVDPEFYYQLPWPPASAEACAHAIVAQLMAWGASAETPVVLFATEDGSLRLVLDYQHLFKPLCYFSHAKNLQMAGLDKAEFFQFLQGQPAAHCVAQTLVVRDPMEVQAALQQLGPAVIKPALKPLSMKLTGMSSKAFRSRDFSEPAALLSALQQCWDLSTHWLVQQELQQSSEADIAVYAVRGPDFYYAMVAEVLERYPAHTGTGCWVRVVDQPNHPALAQAAEILKAIDFNGICEIELMQDQQGSFKVLELNPRPWLQTGLTTAAGVRLLTACTQIFRGTVVAPLSTAQAVSWVCPERMLQHLVATLKTGQNSRWNTLKQGLLAITSAHTFSVYSSTLPGVKRRWLQHMLQQLSKGTQQQ
jgi:predicted ATP-grasp superfamily ATP-dependent carboligase